MTNNKELVDKIMLLRDHGRGKGNEIELWGFNCRMDNLQAAILDLKLKKVPEWISRRREIAGIYQQGLSGIDEIVLPYPPVENGVFFDVYQNYEVEAEKRDGLRSYLTDAGIETMISWGGKGVHQFKALGLTDCELPETENLFEKLLLLPMHPDLTDEEIDYVAASIRKFYKKERTLYEKLHNSYRTPGL